MMDNLMEEKPSDFIREIVAKDIQNNKYQGKVLTRFPPEPNGYLHIGHAKSICLNFGIAKENNAICNLRMDDTNPAKEEIEYVDAIIEDVRWLIQGWADHCLGLKQGKPFFASDYFDELYAFAVELIKKGKAYVCDLSLEQTEEYRGSPEKPGKESPFRHRSIEENLKLFEQMKDGKFANGSCTLRAKIDMASSNIWLRDPILYRIKHVEHHHTGKKWCVYPMYDFAHCLSDYLEGITHSICTLEFEVHRPLYDWILQALDLPNSLPCQYEFARLNMTYTLMSKRKLLDLVEHHVVSGWDDPRMPTISGMRRRGYPAVALREFCKRIGVGKVENMIDFSLLEFCVREELNKKALRVMGVLKPLKVVIINYPNDDVEMLEAINNPEDLSAGKRQIPFGKELFIEQNDFREQADKNFFRLIPGREVRLRYAYFIKCEEVIKNNAGEIVELRCTYDPLTKGGNSPDGRKVKSTIHWVSAKKALAVSVRVYEKLFNTIDPQQTPEGVDYKENLNKNSCVEIMNAKVEPCLLDAQVGDVFQFERLGYFCVDQDSTQEKKVFNRTTTLKDELAKIEKRQINKEIPST